MTTAFPADAASFAQACIEAWSASGRVAMTALVSESTDSALTYPELMERAAAFAGKLEASGVRRAERVAIAMERSTDAVVAIFGTVLAGACPSPLEPRLSPQEISRRLAATGTTRVVFDDANERHVESLGLPRESAVPFASEGFAGFVDEGLGRDDPALLLFTSGSTGNPKGVLLSHGNILANAAGIIAHTGLTPEDRLLHVMPIHHTNGLNNQLFAPFLAGASVIFADRFRAQDMPALIARHRPTIITGVPTMYSRMLDLEFERDSLRGLRFARCGSAPITEELHRRVEEKLGCPLIVSYGLSEATCTSLMNPPARRRIGTVGTVLKGQSVRLRHPASGEEAGIGEEGEIVIGGPSLMLGYIGADPASDRAIADGWLRTGDLGRFDADGYLTITGRIKDVIIRGGENISPGLVESAIAEINGVRACCVVGRKDVDLGEVPVAFVVAAQGARLDADGIIAQIAKRLPRPCHPAEVIFVDALPETGVGKIDRKRVAAMAGS